MSTIFAPGVDRILLRIDDYFGSGEVGSLGADISRVINLVATTSPAHTMRVLLFGSVGRNDVQISYLAALWDFLVVNEEHGVGALDAWVDITKALSY